MTNHPSPALRPFSLSMLTPPRPACTAKCDTEGFAPCPTHLEVGGVFFTHPARDFVRRPREFSRREGVRDQASKSVWTVIIHKMTMRV